MTTVTPGNGVRRWHRQLDQLDTTAIAEANAIRRLLSMTASAHADDAAGEHDVPVRLREPVRLQPRRRAAA